MSDKDVYVRRGQLITTWGIGAIVPLANGQSAMVSGLDQWDNDSPAFAITDERLAKKLKVSSFRCPPPYIKSGRPKEELGKTVPLYVFPLLYYCSSCGFVHFLDPCTRNCPVCWQHEKDKRPRMVPERFIVVCPEGHVMDLPILEKFQQITKGDFDARKWLDDEDGYRATHRIYRVASRNTASLAGISYHLYKRNGDISFTIADLVAPGGLCGLYPNDRCPGSRPWLDHAEHQECEVSHSKLRVVQRGGTNVWIPRIESSIYIPAFAANGGADDYAEVLNAHWDMINEFYGQGDAVLLIACQQALKCRKDLDPSELLKRYLARKGKEEIPEDTEISEDDYRYTEYQALCRTCGKEGDDLLVKSTPISEYNASVQPFFESVSLVKSLKETQALVGFSRIDGSQSDLETLKNRLAKTKVGWLPAVQTLGEGIFFQFSESRLSEWFDSEVKNRAKKITDSLKRVGKSTRVFTEIDAPFVMIHTFAHAFINEVSKVCGYGSSSIRERIYVGSDSKHRMYGVLIYTSGSGSDASLGGLVRQGKPGYLEGLIERAIESIGWCADDPICISSDGQGPDDCNLAACHNCCLLPETCCETGNRFLDRAMLVGNPASNQHFGYFDSLLSNGDENE